MEKRIEDLNLEDDFLFSRVMSDEEICRIVLEKLLNISIKKIVLPEQQKTIDLLLDSKGVWLDIYVNDDVGTIYNCEMQRGKRGQLPKRSRYYQGNIDLDSISKGEPYTSLRRSYIIFICTFDPFTEGRHIYTFQNTCLESPGLLLGDEATKLFFNTKGTIDDIDEEMKEFLTYIENTTDTFAQQAKSSLVKKIHQRVIYVKQSKEMEAEYMTLLQRDRENIEQGERKMAALTELLLDQKRTDDLKRAIRDTAYREQLYKQFNIL